MNMNENYSLQVVNAEYNLEPVEHKVTVLDTVTIYEESDDIVIFM